MIYYVNYDHAINVFKYRIHRILTFELKKEFDQRSDKNPRYVCFFKEKQ